MKAAAEHAARSAGILIHTDLHETTDTDNSEFRPSKQARDGVTEEWSEIPDGFYLVASEHSPEPQWQRAIIEAVEKVTHIAPPDEKGHIIGETVTDRGVITIKGRQWGICGAHTAARFCTTTEVYPDSPKASPEQCNEAQVAVVVSGIQAALALSS